LTLVYREAVEFRCSLTLEVRRSGRA